MKKKLTKRIFAELKAIKKTLKHLSRENLTELECIEEKHKDTSIMTLNESKMNPAHLANLPLSNTRVLVKLELVTGKTVFVNCIYRGDSEENPWDFPIEIVPKEDFHVKSWIYIFN